MRRPSVELLWVCVELIQYRRFGGSKRAKELALFLHLVIYMKTILARLVALFVVVLLTPVAASAFSQRSLCAYNRGPNKRFSGSCPYATKVMANYKKLMRI